MTDQWIKRYTHFAPYVIIIAAIVGYLIAGGIWWGIPIVAAVALVYAVVRVGIAKRTNEAISRKIDRRRA
jgi:branched-subunit amino acid transport protein